MAKNTNDDAVAIRYTIDLAIDCMTGFAHVGKLESTLIVISCLSPR